MKTFYSYGHMIADDWKCEMEHENKNCQMHFQQNEIKGLIFKHTAQQLKYTWRC